MFRAACRLKNSLPQQGRIVVRSSTTSNNSRIVATTELFSHDYSSGLPAFPSMVVGADNKDRFDSPVVMPANNNSKIDAASLLLRSFHNSATTTAAVRGGCSVVIIGGFFNPLRDLHGGGGRRRGFATQANGTNDNNGDTTTFTTDNAASSSSSVDDQLEKLFRENQVLQGDSTAEPWVDGAQSVVSSSGLDFVPTWYNPADQCLTLILKFQEVSGLELGTSIVLTTLAIRVIMFPIVVSGQKSASRMAHVQPELQQLKLRYEKLANPTIDQRQKLGNEVKQIFARYGVKPLRAMVAPFIQFPFFMGMFFGLKKMPDYFPEEMAAGGMFWFPDLTLPDPNYILPGICFLSFLATVEMGKEQMTASNPQNAAFMINMFRGLSLMMIPVVINFHAGMLCYWTVSNLFTLVQIGVMKIPFVKKTVGIWDPPKPVPGLQGGKDGGFMEAAEKLMKEMQGKPTTDVAKMQHHNDRIENKKKVQELSRNSRERRRRSIKKRD